MPLVTSNVILEALEEAGVIRREDRIRRVVIDLKVGEVPVIYVERYGDLKLLSVASALTGVEITHVEPEAEVKPAAKRARS